MDELSSKCKWWWWWWWWWREFLEDKNIVTNLRIFSFRREVRKHSFLKELIYLAALGLSFGMQDLWLQHVGSSSLMRY